MEDNDFKKSNTKKDGNSDHFWDLDFMLPPKKTTAVFSRDTEAVLIDVADGQDKTEPYTSIPRLGTPKPESAKDKAAEPIFSYKPDNPLINKVSVWHWPSKYSFYERFRADAIKYYSLTGSECGFVPFFSYMPQYMQLNREQREYYLWWRENARRNNWIKTDYSYIYLYIYEIINLPDFIAPAKGLEMLCDVWLACRAQFPKLDRYLTEWVCDYCLVNMMDPPYNRLTPVMGAVLDCASFKEFYLKTGEGTQKPYLIALLNFASNYNWRQSKFYNDETAELYEKHIEGAFLYTMEKLADSDRRFKAGEKNIVPAKLTRDAFSGSLCAYNIKRRVDIEYSSCTRSPELRMLVTDLIKCAENHVRALLGIKNRFSVSSLSEKMKSAMAEYFEPFRPKKKPKEPPVPEYMALYESKSDGLSPENALNIERSSWSVTNRLVDAFDAESEPEEAPEEIKESVESKETEEMQAVPGKSEAAPPAADSNNDGSAIAAQVKEGLSVICDKGGTDFAKWANSVNMLPDAAAEMINEALYDIIGDIVLEDNGGVYALIEDYRSDIEEIINK